MRYLLHLIQGVFILWFEAALTFKQAIKVVIWVSDEMDKILIDEDMTQKQKDLEIEVLFQQYQRKLGFR